MFKLRKSNYKNGYISKVKDIKSIWYIKQKYKEQREFKTAIEQSLLTFPF